MLLVHREQDLGSEKSLLIGEDVVAMSGYDLARAADVLHGAAPVSPVPQ